MNYAPRAFVEKTKSKKYRYGRLFPTIQGLSHAFDLPIKRVLSYGCATGEECLTLAELFPDAEIFGTDILPEMVEAAAGTCRDNASIRILPYEEFWSRSGETYDLLTCMSVIIEYPFRHIPKEEWDVALGDPNRWPAVEARYLEAVVKALPFSEFEATIEALDRRVAPGGMFVLFNANYRLRDTRIGPRYRPIILPNGNIETIPQATPEGTPVHRDYTEVIFRKTLTTQYGTGGQ